MIKYTKSHLFGLRPFHASILMRALSEQLSIKRGDMFDYEADPFTHDHFHDVGVETLSTSGKVSIMEPIKT
jgi:hypothetical protein